jgi:hypothetical protein
MYDMDNIYRDIVNFRPKKMLKHCDLATHILSSRINISASYREKLKDYAYVFRSLASNRISLKGQCFIE